MNSLLAVRRVPLTPPKVEQATKMDMSQAMGPNSLEESKIGGKFTCLRKSLLPPQTQAPSRGMLHDKRMIGLVKMMLQYSLLTQHE